MRRASSVRVWATAAVVATAVYGVCRSASASFGDLTVSLNATAPPPTPGAAPAAPPPGAQPPPGYAPAYGYGQPARGYWAYPPGQAPARLKYRDGDPMPPGYHLEYETRKGPLVTGIILGGLPYVIGLGVAAGDSFSNGEGWLILPVIGPWAALKARESRCNNEDEFLFCEAFDDVGSRLLLGLDGVLQGTGALLVLIGVLAKRPWLIKDDTAPVALAPVRFGSSGYGLAAFGSF